MISYPSVTEVISPYADFSMIRPDVLKAAADRGTAVHHICSQIATGLFVVGIDPAYAGYVVSFRRWFDTAVDTVILSEERLMDMAFGYHGQIDLLVRSKEGTVDLVDLKTPAASLKTWKVQLAGYRHLVEISDYPTPDRVGSLRLDRDGGVPRMEWYQNSAQDLNVFVSALNCYRYFNS